MRYKAALMFFVANEVSAATLVIGKEQSISDMAIGGAGFAAFLIILCLFTYLGMFRGLKFRHWTFIILCVVVALAAGYFYGQTPISHR